MTYLLFCFSQCYPSGGWADLVGIYPDIDSAIESGVNDVNPGRDFHIVCDGSVVARTEGYDWSNDVPSVYNKMFNICSKSKDGHRKINELHCLQGFEPSSYDGNPDRDYLAEFKDGGTT